jgi:hypothetical protein
MTIDLNAASEQRSTDVIPTGTIVALQLNIKPGGAGDGGWLTRAANGASEGLQCEFTVTEGEHAKHKIFQRLTLQGKTPGHEEAGKISFNLLRAILESARGIKPNDTSDAAQTARKVSDWGEFDGLRFLAQVGVEPPRDGYAAKNKILSVITPEKQFWRKLEQVAKPASAGAASKPAATTPPAGAIARPQWAG